MLSGSDRDRFVVLAGGLIVTAESLALTLELESRGFHLAADMEKPTVLVVEPGSQLTDEDRIRIRRWKFHVLALLAYQPPASEAIN